MELIKRYLALLLLLVLLAPTSVFAAQISRQADAQIENGQVIDADDLDSEFDSLVSESNSQDTRLTDIESNALTIGGAKTFSSNIKVNGIDERTSANGVTIDSLKIKDTNLPEWLPKNYIYGCEVTYNAAAQVIVNIPCMVSTEDGTVLMELSANKTVDISTSGANGLDTGSEAADTWYYLYVIQKSSDLTTNALISATNESSSGTITQPTGYDRKRQLPIAVRNNSSSNFLEFYVDSGWPQRPEIWYQEDIGDGLIVLDNNVLNSGSATSNTDVDCSSLIPPISETGIFKLLTISNSGVSSTDYKTKGGSQQIRLRANASSGDRQMAVTKLKTNTSQVIQYNGGSANLDNFVWVLGYTVTEVD